MRRTLVALLVTLVGCPGAASPGAATAPVAGQRWRFSVGPRTEQTYEVIEVTEQEVRYRVRTSYAGEALGEPLEQVFVRRPGPAPLESGSPGAPLVVGGRTLETWVTEDGARRVTTAVSGRTPTFPGVVRVERADEVLLELVEVH